MNVSTDRSDDHVGHENREQTMRFIPDRSRILAVAVVAIAATATTGAANADRSRGAHALQFDELDADSDGIVTMAEFEAHGIARFNEFDTDSDGSLGKAEIAGLFGERRSRSRRNRESVTEDRVNRWIDRLIERHDSDENGSISMAELNAHRIERMMEFLDSDGDGQLTNAEFDERSKRRRHGWRGRLRH